MCVCLAILTASAFTRVRRKTAQSDRRPAGPRSHGAAAFDAGMRATVLITRKAARDLSGLFLALRVILHLDEETKFDAAVMAHGFAGLRPLPGREIPYP